MQRCSLSSLSYRLGALRPIDELTELAADPALLEIFKLRGLDQYAVAEESTWTLAHAALAGAVLADGAPSEIDIVLYGTDLTNDVLFTQEGMNDLLVECGLYHTVALGVSLPGCATAISVLEVGRSLILAGAARRVACLVLGRAEPGARRVMDLGMSILSDGAAACVLRAHEGEFEILGTGAGSLPAATRLSLETQSQQYFAAAADNVRKALQGALGPARLSIQDLALVISNNYARHIQQAFLRHAGFEAEQGFFANVARFGHAAAGSTSERTTRCCPSRRWRST